VTRLKIDEAKKEEGVAATSAGKKDEKELRKQEILGARDISAAEAVALSKKSNLSREDFIAKERDSLKNVFIVKDMDGKNSDLERIIDLDQDGKGRKLLKRNFELRSSRATSSMAKVGKAIIKELGLNSESLEGYFDGDLATKVLRKAQYGQIKIKVNGVRIDIRDILREQRLYKSVGKKATCRNFLKVIFAEFGIELEKSGSKMRLKTDTAYLIELNRSAKRKILNKNIEMDLYI